MKSFHEFTNKYWFFTWQNITVTFHIIFQLILQEKFCVYFYEGCFLAVIFYLPRKISQEVTKAR